MRVPDLRLLLGITVAKTASAASKAIGNKGETLSGRILLKIQPDAIALLAAKKTVILVSGTNGKTSTTKAVAQIVAQLGAVTTSGSGSNLSWGAANALMSKAPYAVLEIDELHLSSVVAQCDPAVVLLLNLTRDQLHRMHEVKRVADRWHVACAEAEKTLFIGDIDDPYINYAMAEAHNIVRVSFGGRKHQDGAVCPRCGRYLVWVRDKYSCVCGLNNKITDRKFSKGNAAYRNAVLANVIGEALGATPLEFTQAELERSVTKPFGEKTAHIRLTKNPASWTEALATEHFNDVILILNARQVDGIDTSWLWDVSFKALKGKNVVVCGERALDMAYRLHVEGIEAKVVEKFEAALALTAGSEVCVLAAYTAFFGLVM
jgi:UDP-N-acetylmuramyl tripeptide synthase